MKMKVMVAVMAMVTAISVVVWKAEATVGGHEVAQGAVSLSFSSKNPNEIRALLPGVTIEEKMYDNPMNTPHPDSKVITLSYSAALYDLNNNGKDEVFLVTSGTGMCGSHGCPLDLYSQTNDGAFSHIQSWIVNADIRVLSSTHQSSHDIALPLHWPEKKVEYRIWEWNDTQYKCPSCPSAKTPKEGDNNENL